MLLLKNPRYQSQITHLASQIILSKNSFFTKAFKYATFSPHGYFLLNLRNLTPDNLRVRIGILLDHPSVVYTPATK